MTENSREKILLAATKIAQAHGYNGLNFRDLAEDVGIKAASIYYYFPSKADLAAAVARRYWENAAAALETLLAESSDPLSALRRYPEGRRPARHCGFHAPVRRSSTLCPAPGHRI